MRSIVQRGLEIELKIMPILSPMLGVYKLNKWQFIEFMGVYGDYDAAKKQGCNFPILDVYVQSILAVLDKKSEETV
jgi:hypothetical protein